ncbi:MAG TPA: substrate-binding domain-containing protein [Thermoleophilia bacterium]|nr:substrate-binding domain-containing protein [Thermoleophilia bacterium]
MDKVRHITDVATLKVLARPERLAILRRLMSRPGTLTQLGEALGHHPAWVRHHVLSLEQAGLVEPAGEHKERGYAEKYYRATGRAFAVSLVLLPEDEERTIVVAVGSDDPALDLLADHLGQGPDDLVNLAMGSLEGLIALRQGVGDCCGCHLPDPDGGADHSHVRHLFPGRQLTLVTLADRRAGLMVAPGNPSGLEDLGAVAAQRARFVSRNSGSGTRVRVDALLARAGIPVSALTTPVADARTHDEVAGLVAAGLADAGVGLEVAARCHDLDFIPLYQERYDLVIPRERLEEQRLQALLACIRTPEFSAAVEGLDGYSAAATGHVEQLTA